MANAFTLGLLVLVTLSNSNADVQRLDDVETVIDTGALADEALIESSAASAPAWGFGAFSFGPEDGQSLGDGVKSDQPEDCDDPTAAPVGMCAACRPGGDHGGYLDCGDQYSNCPDDLSKLMFWHPASQNNQLSGELRSSVDGNGNGNGNKNNNGKKPK